MNSFDISGCWTFYFVFEYELIELKWICDQIDDKYCSKNNNLYKYNLVDINLSNFIYLV